MRRLHADRGDNPDPGIGQSTCSKKTVDEQCAIRQRTQFDEQSVRHWLPAVAVELLFNMIATRQNEGPTAPQIKIRP
jgi:hypothetical protein